MKGNYLASSCIACFIVLTTVGTRAFAQEEKAAQLERMRQQAIIAEEKRVEQRQKEWDAVIKTDPRTTAADRMNGKSSYNSVTYVAANSIYVTVDQLVFVYAPPKSKASVPKSERQGQYAFLWEVSDVEQPFSIVLATDKPMRNDDIGDILKSSHVGLCKGVGQSKLPQSHCSTPSGAVVKRMGKGFRIEIPLINSVRMARPVTATRSTFTPAGRVANASVQFLYYDTISERSHEPVRR